GHDGHAARRFLVERGGPAARVREPPSLPDLRDIGHHDTLTRGGQGNGRGHYLQRTAVIRVPCPSWEEMANSLMSLRAPPRPSPRPDPEVQPSLRACSTPAMPGPWSSKVSCKPCRGPSLR